jgi:hypothetical protein
MGLAVVADFVFGYIVSAVNSSTASAESWNKTSAVIAQQLKDIGSSVPLSKIQDYAQSLQQTTLFSQQDILSAEQLITSHQNLATSYQTLTGLAADMATHMGTDLPNATKMLTNALTDPVAGFNQLIRQGNMDFPASTVSAIQAFKVLAWYLASSVVSANWMV